MRVSKSIQLGIIVILTALFFGVHPEVSYACHDGVKHSTGDSCGNTGSTGDGNIMIVDSDDPPNPVGKAGPTGGSPVFSHNGQIFLLPITSTGYERGRLLFESVSCDFFSGDGALEEIGPSVQEGPISILNPGFEDNILPDLGQGPIDSWDVGPSAGSWNPTTDHFTDEAPEGQNTAFSNGSTISQILSDTLAANVLYTLEVEVGNRLDFGFPGYSVELWTVPSELWVGGILLAFDDSLTPIAGSFETSTVTFTSNPNTPNLGSELEIRLTSAGTQTNFDDVRLNVEPAPFFSPTEPAPFFSPTVRINNPGNTVYLERPGSFAGRNIFSFLGNDGTCLQMIPAGIAQNTVIMDPIVDLDTVFVPPFRKVDDAPSLLP